jgi:NADH:ubiquinone oxidoreductase subunit E
MKVTICIGSSCHLKGSRQVVEQLQQLVAESGLKNEIELCGSPCMGNCKEGVCVMVDGTTYSVFPEGAEDFFNKHLRSKKN